MKKFIYVFMLIILALSVNSQTKDTIFTELKENNPQGTSVFTLDNPFIELDKSSLEITFNEVCGKVLSYRILEEKTCQENVSIPIYEYGEECSTAKNGTEECIGTSNLIRTDSEIRYHDCIEEVEYIKEGQQDYQIKADIMMERCENGKFGYSIDWIPTLEHDSIRYTKDEWAWWNASFDYCKNIEIAGANSALVDFPMYINIDNTTNMNDTGRGLAFVNRSCYDDGSIMDHELENITANDGDYWVKIPNVQTTTYNISVYYSLDNDTDYSDPINVWDSNFVAVNHIYEGSGSLVNDSAGTNDGTLAQTDHWKTTGIVNGDYDFDGIDDKYTIDDHDSLTLASGFTLEAWINMADATQFQIINKVDAAATEEFYSYFGAADKLYVWLMDDPVNNYRSRYFPAATTYEGSWLYVTITYDGGTLDSSIEAYYDAILQSATNNGAGVFNQMNNLGSDVVVGARVHGAQWAEGEIDEVRISNTDRSADWINYTYQSIANQSNQVTFGAENTPQIAPTMNTSIILPSNPIVTQNLSLYCRGDDKNFDSLTYHWKAWENLTLNTSGTSNSHTPAISINVANITDLTENKTWNLECTAYDGVANSSPLNSSNVTISPAPAPATPATTSEDEIIFIVVMFIFCYVILWRSGRWLKRLMADFMFMVMGLSTYLLGSTNYPWGVVISAIAIIHMVKHMTEV